MRGSHNYGYYGGVLTSCSNGSEETEPEGIEKTISEVDDVTFNVKTASVGEEKTNVVFTYTRSANGAKERIIIKNCDIEILCNGEKQKTINRLEFALNEYGDFMGDNATQYQCKISIGKKVAPGDIVKVVFKEKTGNVIGEGAESAKIDTLTVSLIDNDEHAGEDGWYNELVENEKEYQALFPKDDDNDSNDDDDQGDEDDDDDDDDQDNIPPAPGVEKTISNVDDVTFNVTTSSLGADNTNLVFTYNRSKDGAKEKITIKECNIEILVNDIKKTTITELDFALNEYDDFVGDKAKQYHCKKSIKTQVSSGDTVKVVFKSKKGKVSGEGESTAQINALTVSLVDNDEKANWYNELVENKKEYQPLFPAEEPETPPTGDEKTEIKFDAFDGWGVYIIGESKGKTVTLSHSEKVEAYSCCGMDIKFGKNNTVEFKVKNNGSETVYVKINIKNEDSGKTTGILTATVNEVKLDYVEYGALAEIEPNETASFVLTLDTTLPEADKFVVSLNSEGDKTNPSSGNITISEAYMWKAE